MDSVSDEDIELIAGGVGRRAMRQIAQVYLGFDDGINDLLKIWDESAINDSEFNKLVLEHWRKNKGETDQKLRLHTALTSAAEGGVDINRECFSFLKEIPHRTGDELQQNTARTRANTIKS